MTPRREQKRAAIMAAATKIFLQNGYAATSMDAIAKEAPVSKATLYNHFHDKKDLFISAIQERCKVLMDAIRQSPTITQSAEDSLTRIAEVFVDLIFHPDALTVNRLLCAESNQFPELPKLYYELAARPAVETLAVYLQGLHDNKILNIPDSYLGAAIFLGMLKGEMYTQCTYGLRKTITSLEAKALIEMSVKIFMKGCAPA